MKLDPTQKLVKSLFDYRDDGFLLWKLGMGINNGRADGIAGSISKRKKIIKRVIYINNKSYLLHRIIFLWHYGWLPEQVDHEDRNQMNNRIGNLRAADKFQNAYNRLLPTKTSVYKGVSFQKTLPNKKWRAEIAHNKKSIYLGIFLTEEEAALVYNKEAVKYHGEFAILNIIKPS